MGADVLHAKKDGVRFSGAGVTDCCEQPCERGCWEQNPCSLGEHQMSNATLIMK